MKQLRGGFTLVEVIIALAILAIALTAAGRATQGTADSSATLKTKLLATWVAQNRLAELQLAQKLPDKGEHSGEAEQGGLRFLWKENVTQTKNQSILRAEITVSASSNADYVAAKLVGFLTDLPAPSSVPNPAVPNPANPPNPGGETDSSPAPADAPAEAPAPGGVPEGESPAPSPVPENQGNN